jgi:hypothetical protein
LSRKFAQTQNLAKAGFGVDHAKSSIVLPLIACAGHWLGGALDDPRNLRRGQFRGQRKHQSHHSGNVGAGHARARHLDPGQAGIESAGGDDPGAGRSEYL